jgi:serine/threonine-protein kinase SRPK3
VWFGGNSDLIPLSDAGIILADFRESFLPSAISRCFSRFVPPEVYFLPEESLSFPADIWALECVIWGIMGQWPLLVHFPDADWAIQEHIDLLGKLPPEWSQKWDASPKWELTVMNAGHGRSGSNFLCRSRGRSLGWSRLTKRRCLSRHSKGQS